MKNYNFGLTNGNPNGSTLLFYHRPSQVLIYSFKLVFMAFVTCRVIHPVFFRISVFSYTFRLCSHHIHNKRKYDYVHTLQIGFVPKNYCFVMTNLILWAMLNVQCFRPSSCSKKILWERGCCYDYLSTQPAECCGMNYLMWSKRTSLSSPEIFYTTSTEIKVPALSNIIKWQNESWFNWTDKEIDFWIKSFYFSH